MTLRAKMGITTVAIVAVALTGFCTATYLLTREYLFGRVDQQLTSIQSAPLPVFSEAPPTAPRPTTAGPLRSSVFLAVIDVNGNVNVPAAAATDRPSPRVPSDLADRVRRMGRSVLVTAETNDGSTYRLLARENPRDQSVLVVGLPLDDAIRTLNRLLAVMVACAAAALAAAAIAATWAVRRGLRPLEEVADTADRIAAGHLSHRVERPGSPLTETGRVATAMNAMLERLETAFSAQRASEERVRAFAADASHELRTPLTAIRGYAELFRRGAASRPSDLELAMTNIESEASRMSDLVDDLLVLARLDETPELDIAPVDIVEIVRNAVDAARAGHPDRRIELVTPDEAVVPGDGSGLRQMIDNLLANAIRHTPDDTPVDVSIDNPREQVVVTVRDHGHGLPPGDPERLFDRFRRGDDSRARASGGTGLGLAIVAAIVRAHDGAVDAENAVGGGAVFTVILPG